MVERAQNRPSPGRPLRPSRLNADYAELLQALQQTPRGRWFLAEFARRNRSADTELVLHAIARLEQRIGAAAQRPAQQADTAQPWPSEVLTAAELELALREAAQGLMRLREANKATRIDVIESAERIADAAWQMRERGYSEALRAEIEGGAEDVLQACAAKDAAAARVAAIGRSLQEMSRRLAAALASPGLPDRAMEDRPRSEPLFKHSAHSTVQAAESQPVSPDLDERLTLLAASIEAGMASLAQSVPEKADPRREQAAPPHAQAEVICRKAAPDGAADVITETAAPEVPRQETRPQSPSSGTEPPYAVALAKLHAAKRAALFG